MKLTRLIIDDLYDGTESTLNRLQSFRHHFPAVKAVKQYV